MNRRRFLAAVPAAIAGCSRPVAPGPAVSSADTDRIAAQQADRGRLAQARARFRVPSDAVRTTPPPPDVLKAFPELKGLTKAAVRLHPRFSDEPKPDESKLGGRFLWPAGEPWPTCPEHGTPFVSVLQLRAEDGPPNTPFRPGTDLFQLLWCPRDHADSRGWVRPAVYWRKRSELTAAAAPPSADGAVPLYVPLPCRLFPERVFELPGLETLPERMRVRVEAWTPEPIKLDPAWGPPGHAADFATTPRGAQVYARLASAADGTKVGGWPRWLQGRENTPCPRCGWGMDFLLTVDSTEWDGSSWVRWMPLEERHVRDGTAAAEDGYCRAAGLRLGDNGNAHLFVCRRCDDWPTTLVGQT